MIITIIMPLAMLLSDVCLSDICL